MLINEGADAVQQGVCTTAGAALAMTLGVNHPPGPFEFLSRWDAVAVATLLGHLAGRPPLRKTDSRARVS